MKISEHWLREWVDPKATTDELAERLTLAGFEVESVAPCAPQLRGVVVGRVRQISPHPQAPRLSICDVDAGAGQSVQVVCGAPNVETGGSYALALPEAELAGGRRIATTSVHGVESRGMLCSGAELGLNDEPGRLLVLDDAPPPGAALATVLALDDRVIELAITPNRGDCLCVAGIAREVAVLYRQELPVPAVLPVPARLERGRAVTLAASEGCPRYAGRVIEHVNARRQT
ncbi:MAG: phenylalanine--tRNA ligase subunit beta, partial [Gammaproteobacteria bacterium]